MRAVWSACVALGCLGLGFGFAEDKSASPPISAEALADAGVLVWKIAIPDDLKAGEHSATVWFVEGKPYASDLDFKGVPPGSEATVVLWLGDVLSYWRNGFKGPRPEGIPFSVSCTDAKGRPKTRFGTLRIPPGYDELYSFLGSGPYADAGYLLLMSTRSDRDVPVSTTTLEFYGWGAGWKVGGFDELGKTDP